MENVFIGPEPKENVLFDLKVSFEGNYVDVRVFLAELSPTNYWNRCVIYKGTPFERSIDIDQNEQGVWCDLMDGHTNFTLALGEAIEQAVRETMLNRKLDKLAACN